MFIFDDQAKHAILSIADVDQVHTRACFLSLARSKLKLRSANHRAGYFSNLACDWLSTVWAYSEIETQSVPRFMSEFTFQAVTYNVTWGRVY